MATNDQKKYIVVELKTTGNTQEIQKSIKKVVTDLKAYEDKLKSINKAYSDQASKLARLKADKKAGFFVDPAEIRKATNELNKLNKQFTITKANKDSNQKAFASYTKEVKQGTSAIGASSKSVMDNRNSMVQLTREILILTAAWQTLKTVVGFVMTSFIDFEATMMNVQGLLDIQNKSLEKGSIQLMKDFGFSIKDVNKALYDAISTAIPAGQAIEFLNDAARLAIGGVTDLKTSVDGLTSIINAYSLNVNQAGRVADAFFKAQKWAKATVAELIDEIGRIAPVASIAGVSYQEMLGAISELTLGGLDAAESVTVLRQAISGVIKPAVGAEEALRKYNVPVGIAEVSNAGLAYTLEKLMEAYKEYPDVIADMIPNIRAFTGVTALTAERLENMRFIIRDISGDWGEFSSLNAAVAKQMTTTDMKIKQMKGDLSSLGVSIGAKLKKPFEWLLRNFKSIGTVLITLIASMIAFAGTFKLVAGWTTVIQRLTAAFAALKTAAGIAAGALSAAVGILTLLFVKAMTKTDEYKASLADLQLQIDSNKKAFAVMTGMLADVIKKLNAATPGTDEYIKLLARKLELIDEINNTYKDYLDNLLTEATTLEELAAIQQKVNDAIGVSIVIKMRASEIQGLGEVWQKNVGEALTDMEEDLLKFFSGPKMPLIGAFQSGFSALIDEYKSQLEELYKSGNATLQNISALRDKAKASAIELAKTTFGMPTQAETNIYPGIGGVEGYYGVIQSEVNTILEQSENYAQALEKINKLTEGWAEAIKKVQAAERETIRERTPTEIMTEPLIGFTGTDTPMMTYDEFVTMTDTLPSDFDFYKKKLMEEYQDMYWELKNVIETGVDATGVAYSTMSAEQRKQDKKLTEMEGDLIKKYTEIYKSLSDVEIDYIKQFNFYGKEKLDFSKALTEEQMKDLKIMIEKWEHDYKKTVIDNNRLIISLQLQFFEDQIQMYEDGYDKEMAMINVNYAKKAALIEANYEKEKESLKKQMDDLGLNNLDELPTGGYAEPQMFEERYSERKKFFDMMLDVERKYQNQLNQIGIFYTTERQRLLYRQLDDIKDFYLKYEKENDKLLNLERQIEKNLKEMARDAFEFTLDSTFLQTLSTNLKLTTADVQMLTDQIKQFALSGQSFEDFWNQIVSTAGVDIAIAQLIQYSDGLLRLQKAYEEFQWQANYQRQKTRSEVLSTIGVLDIEKSQLQERLDLEKELRDNRSGLIESYGKEIYAKKGNIALTKEEADEVINLVNSYEKLALALNEVSQSRESLDARRPSGNVKLGDLYDQRKKEIWASTKMEGWTTPEDTKKQYDKELAELDSFYAQKLVSDKEYRQKKNAIDSKYSGLSDVESAMKLLDREIPSWAREMTERSYENLIAIGNRVADILSNTIGSVFQVINDNEQRAMQRKLDDMNEYHDTELTLLQNRLDKGLISEELYAKKKEEIDKKYKRREEELKKRQFEREKNRAIAQAVIQGAIAAVKSFAELGPLGGWAGVAITAAETALQVAVIAAQKYAKGGAFMVGGNKHSQGGTTFVGSDGSAFEAERGELLAIVNAQDSALINALGSINSIHGKHFGSGGMFRDGGLSQRELNNALSNAINMSAFANAISQLNLSVSIDEINRVGKRVNKIKEVSRF